MSDPETTGLKMLEFDDPDGGLLAFEVGGKITAEQAKPVFDRIQAAADEGRMLRLYCRMHGFPRAEPSVYLEKLKHMSAIFKAVERYAIVGDLSWVDTYAKIFDPITKMELRHFSGEEHATALAWLRE